MIAVALDPAALPIAVAGRGSIALRRFLALRADVKRDPPATLERDEALVERADADHRAVDRDDFGGVQPRVARGVERAVVTQNAHDIVLERRARGGLRNGDGALHARARGLYSDGESARSADRFRPWTSRVRRHLRSAT